MESGIIARDVSFSCETSLAARPAVTRGSYTQANFDLGVLIIRDN